MPQCPLSLSIRQTVTAVLALMTVTVGVGANKQSIESGRAIGQSVPSFYVRAVTGPLRNKSVCYVCRNGSRPCVMVLFRETSPVLGTLLKKIDKVVDRNRAKGLRSFGILISPEPGRAISRLQTMAFNQKIALPLSVATDVVGSPNCQNIHKQAEVTVVLYRRQKVVERFGFRSKELGTAGTAQVLARIKRLLDES